MNAPKIFILILLYYIVWFLSIYFARANLGYVALYVSIVISLIQSTLFITKKHVKPFILWLIAFSLFGYLVDSLFQTYGILSFKFNAWGDYFAPPWILALWINFSVICFGMRRFLMQYAQYMPLLALCGFPLTYAAGIKLGVAHFVYPVLSPLIQGLIWAVLFSGCVYIMNKLLNEINTR
ncbi:MAG: DUF2878 family protein [Legionellaceae bacterium]|nr:DUF2878 family protein [Legionellaceae bacterium]